MRTVSLVTVLCAAVLCVLSPLEAQTLVGNDFSLGLVSPTGEGGEFFKPGYGLGAGFFMGLEDNMRVTVSLGYNRATLDNDALNQSAAGTSGAEFNVEGASTTIPIMIGLKFVPKKEGAKPYGMLEGGIVLYKSKVSGEYTRADGGLVVLPGSEESRVEPGFNVGLGMLFPVGKDLSLDVGLKYNWVKDGRYYNFEGSTSTYVSTAQYFTFAVGLSFAYGE